MDNNYFQNSGYMNQRNRKRTLILDIEDGDSSVPHLGNGGEFNIKLYEPLVIDKHSEVYLDNFLTYNSNITSSSASSAFVLKINEFNMNSNVASTHGAGTVTSGNVTRYVPGGQRLFNSLIIPNEHKDPANNHTTVVHKGKKFNYVCDMNPQTISSLSGSITDLAGNPIFHGGRVGGRFTYALTGINQTMVESDEGFFPLRIGDTITSITSMAGVSLVGGSLSDATGSIIASTPNNAVTLHFALDQELNVGETGLTLGNIVINIQRGSTSGTISLDHDPATQPNLQLIKGDGRFIAEFSIISRE